MTQPEEHTNTALLDEKPDVSHNPQAPVFILGMMPRSGTNFLHRLICKHPDCGAINTTPVREDYLVHHIKWLSRYVGRLKWQWGNWGADAEFVAPVSAHVGQGLTGFLQTLSDANRIVSKTPSVENLSTFFDYFSDAYLLIIVRDGRSIVASGMSGFGWNFETATRKWAGSAQTIQKFMDDNPQYKDRFKLVHYETLNANTLEVLREVLEFLNLDVDSYDLDEALSMPVFGSSFMKEKGETVTWKPQEKQKDFNSSERWNSWSNGRHARFNWIAGKELAALGYEVKDVGSSSKLVHGIRDMFYWCKRYPARAISASREAARAFIDSLQGKGRTKVNLKK